MTSNCWGNANLVEWSFSLESLLLTAITESVVTHSFATPWSRPSTIKHSRLKDMNMAVKFYFLYDQQSINQQLYETIQCLP